MEYKIRALERRDCLETAKLRLSTTEFGFLSAMGLSFQNEILKGTCDSKWGFGLISLDDDGKIIGMVYATTDISRYYRSMFLHRGPSLAFLVILKLVQQPSLFLGLAQYFVYPQRMPFKDIKAEWLSLVVDSKNRGKGIAKKLSLALIDEFKKRGTLRFKSTVAAKNNLSCRLHEKLGFNLLGKIVSCGDQINVYEYKIAK